MGRALRACCVVALIIGVEATVDGQSPPRRDQTIEQLVADAASVPPEFEADVLLRVSALPKVDKEWRRELLDTAYLRAYAAPEQHRRATTLQVPPDSRQGAQVFANATRADARDAAGPRRRADGVRRAASCARPVRVDRSQSRAWGLRRSAGAVRGRVLHRAGTDRPPGVSPQFRRRPELLRALPVARAPALRDAGGRPGHSALPARSDRRGLSRGAAPADSPRQLERRARLLVRRARHHQQNGRSADRRHREGHHRIERDGLACGPISPPSSRLPAARTT